MLNLQRWWLNWNNKRIAAAIAPLVVGMVLISATTVPATAQVERGRSMTTRKIRVAPAPAAIAVPGNAPASFIYGSPIPTPVPVNPYTGQIHRSDFGRRNVVYPPFGNSVLVNPTIQDSTLINPIIINQDGYRRPVYRQPGVYYPY